MDDRFTCNGSFFILFSSHYIFVRYRGLPFDRIFFFCYIFFSPFLELNSQFSAESVLSIIRIEFDNDFNICFFFVSCVNTSRR